MRHQPTLKERRLLNRMLATFLALAGMLLALPLLGLMVAGIPLDPYLEFPPRTHFIRHHGYSGIAFILCAVLVLTAVLPFLHRWVTARGERSSGEGRPRGVFPWWGWMGAAAGIATWILAWNRFSWFSPLQHHTHTPLWLSYILVVNALVCRRDGGCMITDRTAYFLLLFPVSALFWWFFEYLNRFVQNWHYVETEFTAWEYFWYATLPFSTVLPAVLATRDWLLGGAGLCRPFSRFLALNPGRPRALAGLVLVLSGGGLSVIGVWPDYLFPLLWVSPLLIIVSVQCLMGEPHLFQDVTVGDWRQVVAAAGAALICGWFWEMWNYYSLAKWHYTIPFVDRYPIFEMPVLGYAGYLPFGLECAVIGHLAARLIHREQQGGAGAAPPGRR